MVSHQGDSYSVVIAARFQPGAQVWILWVANFRLHTYLPSLSPSYFREQLRSYWTPSHKDTERWLFASSLYLFSCIYHWQYFIHIAYMLLRHRHTKKSSALRFIRLSLVFNSHLLIVFVLATCNTSPGQPPVWISQNWLEPLRILVNSSRKYILALTIWHRSIQSISDSWLDMRKVF